MGIDKNTINKYTKAILNYCLCVILFLILNKIHIVVYIALFISNILDFCMSNIVSSDMALGFFIMIILWHIYVYITTIICCIFKKLDSLKYMVQYL